LEIRLFKYRIRVTILLLSVLIFLTGMVISFTPEDTCIIDTENFPDNKTWQYQLNEMNYLVLRTSSINIIYGLYLTRRQAEELKTLAEEIESLKLPVPDTKGNTYKDLIAVRKTYLILIEYLKDRRQIPDTLEDQVLKLRTLESEIIKKSLLGSHKVIRKDNSCIRCHALPEYFPKGDISRKQTTEISDKKRSRIDLAHVKGLFGDEGVNKLWELRYNIDTILTNGQKHILKSFRCCLLPPSNLKDPANIGQAFVTNEWMNYFREIRKLSDKNWKEYRQLFFLPVEDIIEATLPGIRSKYKNKILADVEKIAEECRKMDEIDFELNKEALCLKLQDALNIDFLIGETNRQKDERLFIAAMYLLFPGSSEIYENILNQEQ